MILYTRKPTDFTQTIRMLDFGRVAIYEINTKNTNSSMVGKKLRSVLITIFPIF